MKTLFRFAAMLLVVLFCWAPKAQAEGALASAYVYTQFDVQGIRKNEDSVRADVADGIAAQVAALSSGKQGLKVFMHTPGQGEGSFFPLFGGGRLGEEVSYTKIPHPGRKAIVIFIRGSIIGREQRAGGNLNIGGYRADNDKVTQIVSFTLRVSYVLSSSGAYLPGGDEVPVSFSQTGKLRNAGKTSVGIPGKGVLGRIFQSGNASTYKDEDATAVRLQVYEEGVAPISFEIGRAIVASYGGQPQAPQDSGGADISPEMGSESRGESDGVGATQKAFQDADGPVTASIGSFLGRNKKWYRGPVIFSGNASSQMKEVRKLIQRSSSKSLGNLANPFRVTLTKADGTKRSVGCTARLQGSNLVFYYLVPRNHKGDDPVWVFPGDYVAPGDPEQDLANYLGE